MLNTLSQWFLGSPARLAGAGVWMFFAGTGALLCALLAQLLLASPDGLDPLAESLPGWPTFFVPETAAGFTIAVTMVCWGVWAMGAGLNAARSASAR